jgi:hypothetical protein
MGALLMNVLYYILFTALLMVVFLLVLDKLNSSIDNQIIEIDGMHYMVPVFNGFHKDPRMIKDVGSVLVCESLAEIMNQKVKMNYPVPGAKSVTTGNSIFADCYHPETETMVDYHPKAHYKYKGPSIYNADENDFYDRHALEQIKKEHISKNKIHYVEVPHLVDMCTYNKNTDDYDCNDHVDREKRKDLIKNYLREQLAMIY